MAEARAADYIVRPTSDVLRQQIDVLKALILHDIKGRFFGNGLGYIVMILWPLVHIAVILVINLHRIAPYGSSMFLYASTAIIPWIASNYIGRFIMLGSITNKCFLQYPIIKPLDLLLARSFLEVVGNFIVVFVVLLALYIARVDIVPFDILQAASAWIASIMLGVGFGIFGGVICLAFPLFQLVFILFIILAWVTCGIGIDPELLPHSIGVIFSYNPVLHAVEWMRSAYYPGYHARLLDKSYLLSWDVILLGGGLLTERLGRAFWLQLR